MQGLSPNGCGLTARHAGFCIPRMVGYFFTVMWPPLSGRSSMSRTTAFSGDQGLWSRWLFVWGGLVAVVAPTTVAWGRAPGPDVNVIQKSLPGLLDAEPALEGAWIDVDRDDQRAARNGSAQLVFTRVFDASRADAQAAAMDRIIAGLAAPGQYRVDTSRDQRLPVSELKGEIGRLIAADQVRFDGCRLLALKIRRNLTDGRVVVVPRFTIRRTGQLPALVAECNRIMGREAAWRDNQVVALDNLPDQYQLQAELATPDPNDVLNRVLDAIRTVPELQGSWLTVDTDDQGHPGVAAKLIVFRRAFDAGRVGQQSAAMDRLMRQLVPNGRFRVDTTKDLQLPLSTLLGELRRIIDIEPAFAGCAIDSAAYIVPRKEAEPRFDLLLSGRVWKQEQIEALHDLCGRLMARDPAWQAAGVGVSPQCADTLAVVAPNPARAAFHYSDAMHHFWARDYGNADRLLAAASLDDPPNLVYRYWRVLAGLASGDDVQAEERLQRTIAGFKVRQQSTEYVEVLRAIYRIQGPLRMSLLAAERRAMRAATLHGPLGSAAPAL